MSQQPQRNSASGRGVPQQRGEHDRPRQDGATGGSDVDSLVRKARFGISTSQVAAGALAAITAAFLGSFFGVAGTVLGAALFSVISTVGGALYQHTMVRTKATVQQRIPVVAPGKKRAAGAVGPEGPPASAAGQPLAGKRSASPTRSASGLSSWRGRRVLGLAGAAAGIFLIGMIAVTGTEVVTGSALSGGEKATTVGKVIRGGPASGPASGGDSVPTSNDTPASQDSQQSGEQQSGDQESGGQRDGGREPDTSGGASTAETGSSRASEQAPAAGDPGSGQQDGLPSTDPGPGSGPEPGGQGSSGSGTGDGSGSGGSGGSDSSGG